MRCCSLKRKDLDIHYQQMSQKYYMFNGSNVLNLREVYIASLPQEFQPKL